MLSTAFVPFMALPLFAVRQSSTMINDKMRGEWGAKMTHNLLQVLQILQVLPSCCDRFVVSMMCIRPTMDWVVNHHPTHRRS